MKQKGLIEVLQEDSSLTREITYEEFQNSIVSCADLDDGVEEAYRTYRNFIEKINK